jgi:hypothetical protein
MSIGRFTRSRSDLVSLITAAAAAIVFAGCGNNSSPPTPSPTHGLKAPIVGLLDKSGAPSDPSFDDALAGYVVPVRWADLQPTAGGPIAPNNAIDTAISQVRAHNAANPSHQWVLKLRISAGIDAPDWAKSIGGAPVSITSDRPVMTGTVGRFWLPAYQAAYSDLQTKLAALYDSVPEIHEVVITMCQTIFSEPLIRQISVPQTSDNLIAAGYTVGADHMCHQAAIRAHQVWTKTISDYTFNPYQVVGPGGRGGTDEQFTEQLQDYCRQVLGPRCGLENNSMRVPIQPGGYASMYQHMKSLGPPITFQLADTKKVGDIAGAIELAASYGAYSVELPKNYAQITTPQALANAEGVLTAANQH